MTATQLACSAENHVAEGDKKRCTRNIMFSPFLLKFAYRERMRNEVMRKYIAIATFRGVIFRLPYYFTVWNNLFSF